MFGPALVSALARSLVAGEPEVEAVVSRAARTLGHRWRWLRPLAQRYVEAFAEGARPRRRDVVRFLLGDADFRQARIRYRGKLRIDDWIGDPPRMQPVAAAEAWKLPVIETVGDLADWLSLYPNELEWFADLKSLCGRQRTEALQHYRYGIVRKRSGGVRLIESPKSNMKAVQRRILSAILDRVPVHPAAHGFTRGRSIVTFARPHVGKEVVLRLDLQDFFPGLPAARVQSFFRTLGNPEEVADRLAGISTNVVPRWVWRNRPSDVGCREWEEARILYGRPHLPQGAPTSPALANLAAFRVDCRLSGLSAAAGAVYTRYADDLAFSGGGQFQSGVERFAAHAAAIALEEGFRVNHRKTRIMAQGARQQLAGVVVNRKVSIARKEIERLEAILTNCIRRGPESQNRDDHPDFRAHLEGRIAFVQMVDAAKGVRLKARFDNIPW